MTGRKKLQALAVNDRFFKNRLRDIGLSLRGLCRRMDIDPTEMLRGFKGDRAFRAHEVIQLAQNLEISVEEVLKNIGMDVPRTIKWTKDDAKKAK